MSKKQQSTILLAVIILFSICLTILAYVFINPLILKKDKQKVLDESKQVFKNEIVFNDVKILDKNKDDASSILTKAILFDGDTRVGYLFKVSENNNFGTIEILVGTKADDTIVNVEITTLDQTMYQKETKQAALNYKGKNITKLADASSGATSISINTLDKMIRDVSDANSRIEKEPVLPYQSWYSNKYEISDTKANVTANITKVETIKDKGTVYTVVLSGNWQDNQDPKTIEAIIGLDNSGKILGILLPSENYNHSKGGYYENVMEYAKTFTGREIKSIPDGEAVPTGTSGNSRRTLFAMIKLVRDQVEAK